MYEDERLRKELGDEGDPLGLSDDLQSILKRTKFRHWDYEREFRQFVSLDDANKEGRLHFWPFSRDLLLREVVLGALCELDMEAVREFVGRLNYEVTVYRARLAFGHFSVVPMESTVP